MAYWHFNQNNSGGSFDFDEKRGITHHVVIEADSRAEAIERALEIGIYFDGCDKGMDCSCCGDRWSEPWDDEGSEHPEVYGRNIRDPEPDDDGPLTGLKWMEEGKETCLHPKSGPIEWFAA